MGHMTRPQLVTALRDRGYTGPVSYTKDRLEELLRAQSTASPTGGTTAQPQPTGDTVTEWRGLVPGTLVRVTGLSGRFKFHYLRRTPKEEYVTVYGGTKNHQQFRSVAPDRIRMANGRPLPEEVAA